MVAPLDENHRIFVLHVLASNVLTLNKLHDSPASWDDLAVELPIQTIRELFTCRVRPGSIDPSLLIRSPYMDGQCRSYRASDRLLELMLSWSPDTSAEAAREEMVNLFDGAPYQTRLPRREDVGFQIPRVIGNAIRCFGRCPFNYAALDQHLADLATRMRTAEGDERGRLARALRNDTFCSARIRAGCAPEANGLHTYQPEFAPIYTGRIMEAGGGTQSCTRAMKDALFRNVPDLRNYDLKAAQAWILLQELEDAGLPRAWITTYLATPDAAQVAADALGISRDGYKQCLYGTIMGSPHNLFPDARRNEVYRVILGECQRDRDRTLRKLREVYADLAALKGEVDAWHDHLLISPACSHVDPTWRRVRTLRNACGQHFKLDGYRADKLRRKAAAFILQGQEAAFIHRLTVLGREHGFAPISNQHDGLVVLGEIPQAAIDRAKEASGLRYATMEVKPFL